MVRNASSRSRCWKAKASFGTANGYRKIGEYVHEKTEGKVGYVHIPDMARRGYAEFHRGFLAEVSYPGLLIDVRYNGGGHVSQLLLEKLSRRRIGYDVPRWGAPHPYPDASVLGPMVAVTNENGGFRWR